MCVLSHFFITSSLPTCSTELSDLFLWSFDGVLEPPLSVKVCYGLVPALIPHVLQSIWLVSISGVLYFRVFSTWCCIQNQVAYVRPHMMFSDEPLPSRSCLGDRMQRAAACAGHCTPYRLPSRHVSIAMVACAFGRFLSGWVPWWLCYRIAYISTVSLDTFHSMVCRRITYPIRSLLCTG